VERLVLVPEGGGGHAGHGAEVGRARGPDMEPWEARLQPEPVRCGALGLSLRRKDGHFDLGAMQGTKWVLGLCVGGGSVVWCGWGWGPNRAQGTCLVGGTEGRYY
jgi:hypothetical protein